MILDSFERQTKARVIVGFGFVLFIVTGLRGIDFGHHWDETFHINSISQAVRKDQYLPTHYYYPTGTFFLTAVTMAPQYVRLAIKHNWSASRFSENVVGFINSHRYLLLNRSIFLVLSALAIVWVYFMGWMWTGDWRSSALGSLILAGSFEFAYHSRFLVPDAIMGQAATLSLMCSIAALTKRSTNWLYWAAAVAGIAFSLKYPGGIVILSVLLIPAVLWSGLSLLERCKYVVIACAIFGVVCLALTPGMVIEPAKFVSNLATQSQVYQASTGDGSFYVVPGLPNLKLMSVYLGGVALSHYLPISALLFCFALVGLYWAFRKDWRCWLIVVVAIVPYLGFFSTRGLMVVRNFQIAIPSVAIFSAMGMIAVYQYVGIYWRRFRGVVVGVVFVCLTLNYFWLVKASFSIDRPISELRVSSLCRELIESEPEHTFTATQSVISVLRLTGSVPSNVAETSALTPPDRVIYLAPIDFAKNRGEWARLDANRRSLYRVSESGPQELNFNYYPSWEGEKRPAVIHYGYAKSRGVLEVLFH